MPPFLMLLAVAFVVLMVMFGRNPVDEWRAEKEKYGKDPVARQINKFNEENEKKAGGNKYTPPPGSTTYRLPADQMNIPAQKLNSQEGAELVRPAPEIPMEQWGSPYPSYMMAPKNNPSAAAGNSAVYPPAGGGTSLVPGRQ